MTKKESIFNGTSSHIPLSDRRPDVVYFDEPSLTDQSMKDSVDLNFIAQRQDMSELMNYRDNWGDRVQDIVNDFTNVIDFQTVQNMIIEAQHMFDSLPARIRSRFRNSPSELLDFLSDESNRDEARVLGLLNPPQDSQIPQGGQGNSAPLGAEDSKAAQGST